VESGITSLSRHQISPLQLLDLRRTHWGIETGLHYCRDVTLKEDATRMTVGNLGNVMAFINNLVLALVRQVKFHNIAQAGWWFASAR
jgi:predicted transposase YbfD/YdcC